MSYRPVRVRIGGRAFLIALLAMLLRPVPAAAHGDPVELIGSLTDLIGRTGGSPAILYRRGKLYHAELRFPEAAADFDKAARWLADDPYSAPSDPQVHAELKRVQLWRARAWLAAGKPETALAAIESYAEKFPEYPLAGLEKARILVALGRIDEGMDLFDSTLATMPNPTPDLYIERARLLLDSAGKPASPAALDRVIAGLDEGLGRLGSPVTLDIEAITVETGAGRLEAALARVERRAAAGGRNDSWLEWQGRLLEMLGRESEAAGAYQAALTVIAALKPSRREAPATRELEERIRGRLVALGVTD